MSVILDLDQLGISAQQAALAFALGAQRCSARAVELSNCPKCADQPQRYIDAAAVFRSLVESLHV